MTKSKQQKQIKTTTKTVGKTCINLLVEISKEVYNNFWYNEMYVSWKKQFLSQGELT